MIKILVAALVLVAPAIEGAAGSAAAGALTPSGAGAAAAEEYPPPLHILPAADELPGWLPDGETMSFEPDDLWEYINGQAESFLLYDFRSVAAGYYLDGDGREIKIDVYEHASPLMAFGIYSQFRRPDGVFFDIGVEAFGDEYSLHFWKGRYYVNLQAYADDAGSAQALHAFGRLVAGKIEDAGDWPAELSLFPAQGLVERSVTYITRGVMGSGRLPAAFVADYLRGGESGKLYLMSPGSADLATELLEWYAGQIGATLREATTAGTRYHYGAGEAPYRGRVLVFRCGRRLGIATGFGADKGHDEALAAEAAVLMAGFEAE